jgi:hypothetical protein
MSGGTGRGGQGEVVCGDFDGGEVVRKGIEAVGRTVVV